jgi:hypothetical protein
VVPKKGVNIPKESIWERLATIDTTGKYERSFELLREGISELASGEIIPPLFLLKKVLFNLKMTQVRYFLSCREISHVSFYYHEDGEINIDEKLNSIYLPINRVIFSLLTFEGKMGRLAKNTMNANSYNDILGMSLAEYIMSFNPFKFGVFLIHTTNLIFLNNDKYIFSCVYKKATIVGRLPDLYNLTESFCAHHTFGGNWSNTRDFRDPRWGDFRIMIKNSPFMEIESIKRMFQ